MPRLTFKIKFQSLWIYKFVRFYSSLLPYGDSEEVARNWNFVIINLFHCLRLTYNDYLIGDSPSESPTKTCSIFVQSLVTKSKITYIFACPHNLLCVDLRYHWRMASIVSEIVVV